MCARCYHIIPEITEIIAAMQQESERVVRTDLQAKIVIAQTSS